MLNAYRNQKFLCGSAEGEGGERTTIFVLLQAKTESLLAYVSMCYTWLMTLDSKTMPKAIHSTVPKYVIPRKPGRVAISQNQLDSTYLLLWGERQKFYYHAVHS